MKIQLTSFREISEGKAYVEFTVLDDRYNYLTHIELSYVVKYNEDENQLNDYQLYKHYFDGIGEDEIFLDNIDWGRIESDQYKALSAFDKKYHISE